MPMEDLRIQTARTAELDGKDLAAARELLDAVFEGDMTEADWEHALGGVHALAWEAEDLVGHASVVTRQLRHEGRRLLTAYVEGVGVRPDRQRAGVGTLAMAALEPHIRDGHDLGALGATEQALRFYEGLGWVKWRGRLSAQSPAGVVPTPEEEGWVLALELGVPLDLDGELTCDWRAGDVW